MAIAFDATSNNEQVQGATLTWSHTCTGSDLYLIVSVGYDITSGGVATGATYNGVPMTEIDNHSDAGVIEVRTFGLANPATGTNNVVVSFTDGTDPGAQIAGAQSFTGVHQTVSTGAVAKEQQDGGETDCAVDVASNVADMVVCNLDCRSGSLRTITIKGGGETEDWNLQIDGFSAFSLGGGARKAGAASSTNIGFTLSSGTEWAIMGVALKPAPAGAAFTSKTMILN